MWTVLRRPRTRTAATKPWDFSFPIVEDVSNSSSDKAGRLSVKWRSATRLVIQHSLRSPLNCTTVSSATLPPSAPSRSSIVSQSPVARIVSISTVARWSSSSSSSEDIAVGNGRPPTLRSHTNFKVFFDEFRSSVVKKSSRILTISLVSYKIHHEFF